MREMKESGIPWIGEIPKNWELIKGKYIFTQRNQKDNKINLELLSPTQNYGVIPQKKYEELSGMNAVKLKESTDLHLLKTIHKGDYCISLRSFQGGFEYSEYEGVVSPAYQVFYPITPIDRGYYKYLFKEKTFINKMNSYTMSMRDGKNIAFTDFGNTYIPFPPVQEQHCIADFLDSKCAKIDSIKKNVEAEIETLQAYKKSLITRAVTQGLDSHVEMKDSGVKWIGKIPKKWKVERLKYLYDKKFGDAVRVGPFGNTLKTQDFCDSGPWIYSQRTVLDNNFTDNTLHVTKQKANQLASFRVQPHDILITTRGTIGKIAIVPENAPEGILHPCLIRFRVHGINQFFLRYIFNETDITMEQIISKSLGTTIPVIYSYNLKNILLPIPSLNEQNSIVKYLDSKCSEIDSIIASKQKQSEILSDYKKSLIYEVVTGKKEVPVHE